MNNINKILDNLGLAGSIAGVGGPLVAGAENTLVGSLGLGASNPLGAAFGIGANDPLAAGAGLLGTGMMSDGLSSGGNPAPTQSQTPDYSYVNNLPDTLPDMQWPSVSVPDSVKAAEPEEEFNYQKMLESLAAGSESLAESSEPTSTPSTGVSRGMAPQGPAPVMYGNMTGASPGMQAIKNNQPMIGGQPSIEQILQSLAR